MKQFSELSSILSQYISLNKARLDCLSRLVFALCMVKTVNLAELAVAFESQACVASRYMRLHRFFAQVKFDYTQIARWLFSLFFSPDQKIYITFDRTNWFWGKSKINVFTLAIAYEGIAIPIFWTLLNKAGTSTAKEQITLLKRFTDCFGKDNIAGVMGDREFANEQLFHWLNSENIPFYIRIKDGSVIRFKGKKWRKAKSLFRQLQRGEYNSFSMKVTIFNQPVFLAGSRSETGELMVVATNQKPDNAIPIYLRRWEIETLFHALKGRGFRFEDTRLTDPKRIERLLVLLAIGFCWAHKIGEWQADKYPIRFKRFDKQRRPQSSYFRYGLDHIRDKLMKTNTLYRHIKTLIRHLIPEKYPSYSINKEVL